MEKEQTVNVREFLRNYKKFANKKTTIIISSNGKPKGVFIPYEKWEKQQKKGKNKISLLEAIEKYTFNSGIKDLSQKVDEICYGARNPYRNDND